MAKLIYSAIMSLDGYTADPDGNFNWSAPDEEIHAFINDLERDVGTYLLGRRMYEVMSVWATMDTRDEPPVIQDYARIWQGADKVVYSTTLDTASTPKTRLVRRFDPERVQDMKRSSDRDISIGGPTLAAHALNAGLVDECQLFINPVAVGGGLRFLPEGLKAQLELVDQRRFGNGVAYLRYRAR
ncbi:dihydrofolate reductase family protein [Pseudarthrobacter sp. fls2-241-R2A-127]|uniref:dihydrofolate reductase family protein n=1 Tax=Pseudarthrobacter sp. fls2-241-R2A-127 TaxID=3040303 RepID=UPI0025553238|nr:dihydrofolate reductase family protein [Pseudarthrobacter sp. fls2-241-R2A-127]